MPHSTLLFEHKFWGYLRQVISTLLRKIPLNKERVHGMSPPEMTYLMRSLSMKSQLTHTALFWMVVTTWNRGQRILHQQQEQ